MNADNYDTCDNCKDGENLVKCQYCDDSNCASCGLWWPTRDAHGGCDGSCQPETEE